MGGARYRRYGDGGSGHWTGPNDYETIAVQDKEQGKAK